MPAASSLPRLKREITIGRFGWLGFSQDFSPRFRKSGPSRRGDTPFSIKSQFTRLHTLCSTHKGIVGVRQLAAAFSRADSSGRSSSLQQVTVAESADESPRSKIRRLCRGEKCGLKRRGGVNPPLRLRRCYDAMGNTSEAHPRESVPGTIFFLLKLTVTDRALNSWHRLAGDLATAKAVLLRPQEDVDDQRGLTPAL